MNIIGISLDEKRLIFADSKHVMCNFTDIDFSLEMLWEMCSQNFIEDENYSEIISSVFSKYKINEKNKKFDSKGKILEFDVSSSMYDCLAYEETQGFYDECDCPPPEFWIAYIDGKILSYIPEKYIELANLGVEISMSDSLRWLPVITE